MAAEAGGRLFPKPRFWKAECREVFLCRLFGVYYLDKAAICF